MKFFASAILFLSCSIVAFAADTSPAGAAKKAMALTDVLESMGTVRNDCTQDRTPAESLGRTIEVNKNNAPQGSIESLEPYPLPKGGEKRVVIYLGTAPNEDELEVELLAGKMKNIDCNNYHLADSSITENTIRGWGYTLYQVKVGDNLFGTLMGCSPGSEHMAFVPGASTKVRYNSRLPLVLYTADNVIIKYRVWSAPASFTKTE